MLIEREDVLASLVPLLGQAVAGHGNLVFLAGEAGVGKTSVLRALAESADALTVRRGGCDNVTTPAALGPFVEAVPDLADLAEGDEEIERIRLFRRLSIALTATPTLLLLEDVHWADESTLEMLRFLGRRLDGLPLLVVATFRDDELSGSHPLTPVLGDLATSPGVGRLHLSPLSTAGVTRLLADAGSVLDADQLHQVTGGNPFYVTEVIAAGEQRLPATVRDAVLARTSRLTDGAQRVLGAAAVLGQRATLKVLVAVSGEADAAVDECVRRGVLVGEGETWEFRHELARVAVEQSLSPGARTDLHAAALRTLQTSAAHDDRRLAHHAAGCGDRDAVLHHAPRAAARAARLGAHREAAEQYRLTLRFDDRLDDGRAQLFADLSYECYLTDQLDEALSARREALALFQAAGDPMAVGASQRWVSRLSWFVGRNADSEQYAALAIGTMEPLGDSHELAMAYSNLAQLRMLGADSAGAAEWGNRALDLARRLGDRDTEIHALNNLGSAMAFADGSLKGRELVARSLDMALADDSHEHAARAYTNLGTTATESRRWAEADRYLRAGVAYCADRDLDSWRIYMSAWLARSLAEQGRYDEAQRYVDEVLRQPHLPTISRIPASVVAGLLAVRRGVDSTHLADVVEAASRTGEAQRLVPLAAARAEAAWVAGSASEVVLEVDRAWDTALKHPKPWDLGELSWWLAVGGVRRETPVPVAEPFALMLEGAWADAADRWRALGCPLWAALSLASSPDLSDARAALGIIDAIGAAPVHQAVLRDRHARGLPVPRGPRAASRENPAGLTAREVDVLRLLAEGLSNADVAQRLFLSEKTVGHHVSAVLRKLDEPTRSRAVAAALRRGIVAPG